METPEARLNRLGRELPGVEPAVSYGTPSLKVRGKFMARLKDEETLVVKCPLAEKAFLTEAAPDIFFESDHYHGYDALLLRLHHADDNTIRGRLKQAWRMQAPKRLQETVFLEAKAR